MLGDMAPFLGVAVLLVAISSYVSGTEVALFALRRIDREQMARSGRPIDALVLGLLGQPRKLISTVLVGNESVNGTLAALTLIALGELIPEAPIGVRAGIALAITLPIVVLVGEVAAKTLALKEPKSWARLAARPFVVLVVLLTPVRWLLQGVAGLILRPLGTTARPRAERDLSEEEFRTLVDAGSDQGQVDARERRIIHKVFEFGDKTVGQVMTPREKIVALSYDLPMARLVKEIAARGYTRVPIYQRSLDNVRGVLNAKDLVRWSASSAAPRTLGELLHEPLFVPRTTPIKRLFRLFKQKKVHMALVVNEYGKVLGLATMDDLLAQLFGQMRDEREGLQKAAIRRGRGGRTPAPGVPLTGPFALEDLGAGDGAAHRGEDVTPPPVDPVEAMAREAARARLAGGHRPSDAAPALADDPAAAGPADEPGEGDGEHAAAAEPPAGAGEPGTPVPVVDVITGPSGPVTMARGRERDSVILADLITIVLVCVAAQAFFAGAELALGACSRVRLRQRAAAGRLGARLAESLLARPQIMLSTTLLGANVATLVAALAAAVWLDGQGYSPLLAAPLVMLPMLAFGQVVPRAIFQAQADRVVGVVAPLVALVSWLLRPLVLVVSGFAGAMTRLTGTDRKKAFVTRDELAMLIESNPETDKPDITADEREMIANVFELSEYTVEDLMVPLSEVTALSEDTSHAEAAIEIADKQHSRIPVYRSRVDDIVGIVHVFDILQGAGRTVGAVARPATYVPVSMKAIELLVELQAEGNHVAVVVDEYGGAVGIVSLEDLVEAVVGEIEDEHDDEPSPIKAEKAGSWRIEARTPVDRINQELDLGLPESDEYETIAGLLIDKLRHIPERGDQVQVAGVTIEVVAASDRAIEAVRITRKKK